MMNSNEKLTAELSVAEIEASIKAGHNLFTPVEIAALLNRDPATVRVWFAQKKIRGVKTNGMWRTTYEEIIRYISEGPFKEER